MMDDYRFAELEKEEIEKLLEYKSTIRYYRVDYIIANDYLEITNIMPGNKYDYLIEKVYKKRDLQNAKFVDGYAKIPIYEVEYRIPKNADLDFYNYDKYSIYRIE